MARSKIELPGNFSFTATVPIRITDLNYGGHVGNDTILSIIHEARLQYLSAHGFSELDFGGTGMIMSDVSIEFKQELFYGDVVKADIAPGEMSKVSFAIFYRLRREKDSALVAVARTGMVCYNYAAKKIAPIPDTAKRLFDIE